MVHCYFFDHIPDHRLKYHVGTIHQSLIDISEKTCKTLPKNFNKTYQGSTTVALAWAIHSTRANHFFFWIFDIIYIFTGFIGYQSYCCLMGLSCWIRRTSLSPSSGIAVHWSRLNNYVMMKTDNTTWNLRGQEYFEYKLDECIVRNSHFSSV